MKFSRLSKAYLRQADARLKSADSAFRGRNYAFCVRLSQEAVELSTKALLRSVGIEYPKFHDTSPALRAASQGLPEDDVEFLAATAETLARKRALAMYGDDSRNLGPDEIFKKEDAHEAVRLARRALKSCAELIRARTKLSEV